MQIEDYDLSFGWDKWRVKKMEYLASRIVEEIKVKDDCWRSTGIRVYWFGQYAFSLDLIAKPKLWEARGIRIPASRNTMLCLERMEELGYSFEKEGEAVVIKGGNGVP